jgi:hypothetical protein
MNRCSRRSGRDLDAIRPEKSLFTKRKYLKIIVAARLAMRYQSQFRLAINAIAAVFVQRHVPFRSVTSRPADHARI